MKTDDYIKRSDALEAMMTCRSLTGVAKLEAVNHIMPIPAADVEPVRHGHWYFRGGRPCCSVCNTKALLKDEGGTGGFSHEYVGAKSKRCPECGAKMDAESPKEENDAE